MFSQFRPSTIAIAVLAIGLALSTIQIQAQKAIIAKLRGDLQLASANIAASQAVNAQCDAATKAMRAAADSQLKALDKAAANLQALGSKLAHTRAALQAKESRDNAIPECAALLQTDIRVCPGHADALRLRSNSGPRD